MNTKFKPGCKPGPGRPKTGGKKSNALRSKWQSRLEKDLPNLWETYQNLPPSIEKVRLGLAMHNLILPKLSTQKLQEAPATTTMDIEITLDLGSDNQIGEPDPSIKAMEADVPEINMPIEQIRLQEPITHQKSCISII